MIKHQYIEFCPPHYFEDNMYANSSYKFRKFLDEYCKELNIPIPDTYAKRQAMRAEYQTDIKHNDMCDDSETLMSWLDETYLKKINEEKNNMKSVGLAPLSQITGMTYSMMIVDDVMPAPMPCEPVGPWKVPAPKKKNMECCKQEQEKEDTMTTYNDIEASRKYLNQRISDIFYAKERDLTDTFKLRNPERPQTYQQLIDAIKNGTYELNTKKTAQIDEYMADEGYYFGSMLDGIEWKLPDGPDREGFNVAIKAAKAAMTVAKDVVNTQDAAAGLAALQTFEAWTYTATTA